MKKLILYLQSTNYEYLVGVLLICAFALFFFYPPSESLLIIVTLIASVSTFVEAARSTLKFRISIESFNTFALVASLVTGEVASAAFIALMLNFARLLEKSTENKNRSAIEELLKLKPSKALMEIGGVMSEIPIEQVREGDTLIVKMGDRVPVDGQVIFGTAEVNESSVTGESRLIKKIVGDSVASTTINESGTIKIRATKVGKESTYERMIALVEQAAANKSRSEKIADRFASIFLPVVVLIGVIVYMFTGNIQMTIAIFVVACADDMAVAIPLAMTASIARAAKRGVIIKGGEWLIALGKLKTIVLDKTGTLTYGTLKIQDKYINPKIKEEFFWDAVYLAEKYSEHPVGRVIFHEATKFSKVNKDPSDFKVIKGSGVIASYEGTSVVVGNEGLLKQEGVILAEENKALVNSFNEQSDDSVVFIGINSELAGMFRVSDIPRENAKESLRQIRASGIERIVIFTGDNEKIANKIADNLGVKEVYSEMKPEDKLRGIEDLEKFGPLAMVGDGINDAPALSRANIGIAMGGVGTAVSVSAADVVILTDDLSRIAEVINLSKKTSSVINWDMIIWALSNAVGFGLVISGIASPVFAAFYNFATDFLPLINSTRLYRK